MAKVCLTEYVDAWSSPWHWQSSTWFMPDDNFLISVGPFAEEVLFSDDIWHLYDRGVAANKGCSITITYSDELNDELALYNIKQSKSILLALDRHAFKSPGHPLGLASMNRYNLALQHVRRYCRKHGHSVFDVLANSKKLGGAYELYSSRAASSSPALRDLVAKLSLLPLRYVGFKPALMPFGMMKSPKEEAAREFHQTEIIPTKIYLNLLVSYKEVVNDYLAVKYKMRALARHVSFDPHYGRSGNGHKGKSLTFEAALRVDGLEEYASKYKITSTVELQRHFGMVYYSCIMLIYAFTGMRKSEAYSLKLSSLRHKTKHGIIVARGLAGFTTKFRGVRKRVVWYTSVDVEAPFEAASHICNTIMICNEVYLKDQYLFVSTGYFPFASSSKNMTWLDSSNPTCGNYEPSKYHMHMDMPTITATDLNELGALNPFRVWEAEDVFQIGNEWPLKIHQFRRSTAIYAIASGLVSLPALKEMLKHLTVAMSRYYAKGSVYAHDILNRNEGDKDAWVVRYQESETFVRAFQYVQELIIPDEVLHGPAGVWIERNSKSSLKALGYAESLEQTLKKMKKGQIYYRPTPVGGCTFNGVCEKRLSVSFVGCDGCSYSAVKKTKLIRLISIQESIVKTLEGKPEYQFENNTLHELKEFSNKVGVN